MTRTTCHPPATCSPRAATDAPDKSILAGGLLSIVPPSDDQITHARRAVREEDIDRDTLECAIGVLAESPDPLDRSLAVELRRARLWTDRAQAEASDYAAWDGAPQVPVFDEMPDAWGKAARWVCLAVLLAVLAAIAGAAFGAAAYHAEHAVSPYGVMQ